MTRLPRRTSRRSKHEPDDKSRLRDTRSWRSCRRCASRCADSLRHFGTWVARRVASRSLARVHVRSVRVSWKIRANSRIRSSSGTCRVTPSARFRETHYTGRRHLRLRAEDEISRSRESETEYLTSRCVPHCNGGWPVCEYQADRDRKLLYVVHCLD